VASAIDRVARRLVPLALLAPLAPLALTPGQALAQPPSTSWTPAAAYPLPAGATGGATSTEIAYATGGVATVAYIDAGSTLHVGTITPGSGYDEQLNIPATSTASPAAVALAEAPDGTAVVEWTQIDGTDPATATQSYLASERAAGSDTWSAAVTIATGPPTATARLLPAVSTDDALAAAVEHPDQGQTGDRLDVVTASPSTTWAGPTQLDPGTAIAGAALAYDAAGNLTAAFDQTGTLVTDELTASGWGPLQQITTTSQGAAGAPQLAVAPTGSAVIAFPVTAAGASSPAEIGVVTRTTAAGGWSTPTGLVPGSQSAPLAAAFSPAGDGAYVLYQAAGCVGIVRAVAGHGFTGPQCLTPATLTTPAAGALAFDDQGDAYAAWSEQGTVDAAEWPAPTGAAPGSVAQLAAAGGTAALTQLVADGNGGVAALWSGGAAPLTDAAIDGGPILVSDDIPANVVAVRDTTFDATFADLWSALTGSPTWSFGDGSTETGAQVAHDYTVPGDYTITVTASDAAGVTSTETFPVLVGPPVPRLSAVSETSTRWHEGRAPYGILPIAPPLPAHRPRRAPTGTTWRFTLSQAATVSFTITREIAGRVLGGSCHALTRANRRRRKCTIARTAGTIALAAPAGLSVLRFQGVLPSGARLPTGTYTVTLVATGVDGASSTHTLTFTILSAPVPAR
jgi:hypothetical protein